MYFVPIVDRCAGVVVGVLGLEWFRMSNLCVRIGEGRSFQIDVSGRSNIARPADYVTPLIRVNLPRLLLRFTAVHRHAVVEAESTRR